MNGNETSHALYRTAIIETDKGRIVEVDFSENSETLEGQTIHLRILGIQEEHPRIAEVKLAALGRARNVIGDEIDRLERIRDQVGPDEDQ